MSESIVGGTYEPEHSSVVGVVTENGTLRCSALVIAAKVVLTAGHCIVDGEPPLAISVGPELSGQKFMSVDSVLHPLFEATGPLGSSYLHDIALLRTAKGLGVDPIPIAEEAPTVGAFVEVVGYGRNSSDPDSAGIRRVGKAQVSALSSLLLQLQPGPELPCFFDSGGPALGEDLRAVGVISTGDGQCAKYAHVTRLDIERAFIASYLQAIPRDDWEASQESPFPSESACQIAVPICRRSIRDASLLLLAILTLLVGSRRSKPRQARQMHETVRLGMRNTALRDSARMSTQPALLSRHRG